MFPAATAAAALLPVALGPFAGLRYSSTVSTERVQHTVSKEDKRAMSEPEPT